MAKTHLQDIFIRHTLILMNTHIHQTTQTVHSLHTLYININLLAEVPDTKVEPNELLLYFY